MTKSRGRPADSKFGVSRPENFSARDLHRPDERDLPARLAAAATDR
ncbi:hypothetical protein HYG77_02750 [Rhodococcus sp. ZPP]|nr:hypothetical protein [Rhodococcus sp. ZPP]QTJ64628.1 hypothetical protein HYG77_02750 [Rhodococcus sp. ZPP]